MSQVETKIDDSYKFFDLKGLPANFQECSLITPLKEKN